MSEFVDVWLNADGKIHGIFPKRADALCSALGATGGVRLDVPRSEAVSEIRRQVFERDDYTCVHCGELVTWKTGHMDEFVSRGKGGEVSVDNCQTLCANCHIGPQGKHGNRRPKFKGTR